MAYLILFNLQLTIRYSSYQALNAAVIHYSFYVKCVGYFCSS